MSNLSQQLTGDRPLPSQDALLAAHGRISDEYGRLEQQRSTQLASVPGATVLLGGASVFLGATSTSAAFTHFVLALGFLGMFATFGLYFREVELESESNSVVKQLLIYERSLQLPHTIFSPHSSHKFVNKANSAILIYASSFTAWFCVATWFVLPGLAIILAIFVLIVIMLVQRLIREVRRSSLQQPQQQSAMG